MSDSLPPMTDEALGDIENRLNAVEQFNPLPWTSEYDSFGVEINFGPTFKIEDANGDLVFATDSIQDLADLLRFAPTDLRDLLDENARLNAELSDFREMAVLNTRAHNEALAARDRTVEALSARLTAKNAELDKVIREAAANKAKLAAVEKAVRDSYPWECDSPTHNRICHLRALTPVNIALGGSEMPRPPAEEAQDGPKPFGTGSGRGTGVAEAPGPAQESEWPDVDGWSVRLIGGEVVVRHEADERQLSGWDIPLGAVLAFIEEQQPEEDDEEQADLSLIPADLIKSDPGIRGGEPCIDGTRIPVSEVAGYLADGLSWDEVREMVPSLPVPSTEEGQ